jgi:hypothetical protein
MIMPCIVDGHHGVYVPQVWAESYGSAAIESASVSAEHVTTLLAGPDHADYWESWDRVLESYQHETENETYYLWQDGDLFEISQTEIDEMGDEIW